MASGEDVLRIAAGELGYSRWDDPEAGTKYGRWYAQQVGDSYYGESGVPFCAMFVSWCMHQAGLDFTYAYCPYILRDFSGNLVYNEDAKPGDIVLFNWDGGEVDHVGFIEVNCGSYFQTIEGNTNNGQVARRTRSFDVVAAVIRPPFYDGGSSGSQGSGSSSSSSDDETWWWGPKTTTRCQEQRGTTVDGIVSDQPSCNREHVPAADPDSWDWQDASGGNSELVMSLQRMCGASVDGWFGPQSATALQQWLQDHGYDVGSCGVDGYFGSDSVRALCAALDDEALRC